MKIIITESQLNLINEALGVPDNILDAADTLYDIVEQNLNKINSQKDEYQFKGKLKFEIGGKKKVKINSYILTVYIEQIDDEEGVLDIVRMSVEGGFFFNRDTYMKENEPSTNLEFTITFAVGENWRPEDLVKKLQEEKEEHVSALAHEIKHKYDKQVKQFSLIGNDAEYHATQKRATFGIQVIDMVFFRYLYYISGIENLVRPTEVASLIKQKNITKSKFKEFLNNNLTYKELVEIKNFTFDNFISKLKEEEERLDDLLEHINDDPSNMTIDEKINRVLEIVYIDLVNNKMDLFVTMTTHTTDDFLRMALDIGLLPPNAEKNIEGFKKTNEIRQKFFNYAIKYQKNPTNFFENEFKNFNFVANKMLKKISKLYAMANDDEQVSESIINWELNQKIMEKKYGKKKIETEIKDWKIK